MAEELDIWRGRDGDGNKEKERQTEIGAGMGIVAQSSYQEGFLKCTRKGRLEWCESLLSQICAMSFFVVITLRLTGRQCVINTPHTVSTEV